MGIKVETSWQQDMIWCIVISITNAINDNAAITKKIENDTGLQAGIDFDPISPPASIIDVKDVWYHGGIAAGGPKTYCNVYLNSKEAFTVFKLHYN